MRGYVVTSIVSLTERRSLAEDVGTAVVGNERRMGRVAVFTIDHTGRACAAVVHCRQPGILPSTKSTKMSQGFRQLRVGTEL